MKVEKLIEEHLIPLVQKNADLIPLTELKSIKGISQNQVLLGVIKLIFKERVTIQTSRREREDLRVSFLQTARKHDLSLCEFHKICQCIDVYYYFRTRYEWNDFIECLPNAARNWSILDFLNHNGRRLLDLKVICRWVTGYCSGHSPMALSELGLSAEEIINIHQEMAINDFIPLNQELLDIKAERSAYYISGILRPRLIELALNRPIPCIERTQLYGKGLYLERSANDISPVDLCYNVDESVLFSEVFDLANNIGPDSNSTLTLLLHGKSGTGKTEFANQLARQLGGGIMQLNFPEIQSKYIGETEKNLQKVFAMYQRARRERAQPLVLLINEADGIMNSRVRINSSNDAFHNQNQTVMLELLESATGIVVATTNQIENVDPAFFRRFMFKQEIRLPQRDARVAIIKNLNCEQYMSGDLIELLICSEWSPGSMAIIMNRIRRLSAIKTLNDDYIISILRGEGVIKSSVNIGFQLSPKIKNHG